MPNRQMTVLYVDDDPDLSRLVMRTLARRGHIVERAGSGPEALARIERGGVDVMALDHFLGGGTGLEVLAALEKRAGAPPVVYVTASGEASVAVAALKAGAYDYVAKTVDEEFMELLGNAIDQAVEKARLMRARDLAEREMREARERAEALLHECNHRVANSLSLVAALVRIQARAHTDEATRQALEGVQARIIAIGSVHRRLYTSEDVRSVELSGYLSGLVAELESSWGGSGRQGIALDLEQIQVPTDKAVSIGVVVTELVVNALKYAYPSEAVGGEVRVRLRRLHARRAELAIEDDGVGWDGKGPARGTGIGSRIVGAMARGLGSEVEYRREGGCRVRLEFDV